MSIRSGKAGSRQSGAWKTAAWKTRAWKTSGTGICAAALMAGGALVATAGGPAGAAAVQAKASAAAAGTLTIAFGNNTPFTDDFNPFSPSSELPAQGLIYEPLWFFDMADAAQNHPWLASSYAWSNGGKTLTFNLRQGVKWSDGQPFTSADVAFTFNLIKANKALNESALPIASAVAEGPNKVAINFTAPSYTDINYIAGTTYIVPAHIWKTVTNPSTYQDPKPVGTGSYGLGSITGQVMTLTANPNYYMPGLPKIGTLRYLYFSGNTSIDLAIESGQVGWGGAFIPNIKQTYEAKNPNYHVIDIPAAIINIVPNMVSGPTASLAVRQAFSEAINRTFVGQSVYDGLVAPINQTGLVQPLYSSITNPALDKPYVFSDAAAKKTLEAAGYTLGSNGFFSKGGKELTISIQVPSGYTDYVSILQILEQQMKAAGINLVVDAESLSEYSSNRANGNFQFLIEYYGFTPSPYVYYKNLLDSAGIPAIGQLDSAGDYGRYSNPTVNSLFNAIAATPNVASQKPDFYKIEAIVNKVLPIIPVSDQQGDTEFNGNVVTGYPTLTNPYAEDVPIAPDYAWVTPRLSLVK
jgi:peptide/nickel transport system substrate-binding protein